MLVAVFDTETAAFEGLNTLRDLRKEGGISLYASSLIVKAIMLNGPADGAFVMYRFAPCRK